MPAITNDFGPEYGQLRQVAKSFGVSRSVMQNLVHEEKVQSFLLRRSPHSKQGVRLIKISSVRAYFEAEAAKYAKQKATGDLPVIAERGREAIAANRARRRAKNEPAKPSV